MSTDVSEPEETDSRSTDAEWLTVSRMLRLLAKLEEPARVRVMAYLASRFKEQPR